MTSAKTCSVLKDVVAYVDVWSSEKTANYSKPFIQQLQEMGAQVSKTFNKQVTHVVFNNGHSATWRKAKKSKVRLVSVLWVGRCYDEGEHLDEELFPALNEESNPLLKNKKHRCMQPKDSPARTPENDTRMRKRLDKMMKDLAPKEPLVTDVSPIIIDEANGIVYSPALKRSEYMAQRLKDMKEKHENLSPTASQMVESCSPTGLKPSIGSTPTVLKLMFDQSDDDSSASAAEPGHSPSKEEGRTEADGTTHDHLEHCHRKTFDKPRLSSCPSVPTGITSPLKCPDFKDKEEKGQKKLRRTSDRKKSTEKHKSVGSLEGPWQDKGTDKSNNLHEVKKRPQVKSLSLSMGKSEKGKQKVKAAASFTETISHFSTDAVNASKPQFSPAKVSDAEVKLSSETLTPVQKTPKRAKTSFSSLVRSFTESSDFKSAPSCSTGGDDDVFEDYFSPANFKQKSKKSILPNLPPDSDLHIPLELDPVPKKRKQRKSDIMGSGASNKKKKLEESEIGQKDKNLNQQSKSSLEPPPQQDVKESVPVLERSCVDLPLVAKRGRQSTLPFTITSTTTSCSAKRRRASKSAKPTVSDTSHTVESRGNERTVAAGSTEIQSEGEDNPREQVSLSIQKIVNKEKAMRTLVTTSLPTEKQHVVGQVVKALGGFSVVDQVSESTTHVVSGGQRRTLNILLGIARGCWILSFEWILWSLEQRQWIPEEPYELSDHFPSAQICRLQRHLSAGEHQQDLFQGQPVMFVSQHSQPPTQSLVELIQLCGGTVCKTVRQAGICIGKHSGRRPEGSRVLSEQWVLDSITHLKLLSFDNYYLE